jgi:hypothetical protein
VTKADEKISKRFPISIVQKEQNQGMAEEASEKHPPANPDEVALELMKFVAVTTGYGKGTPVAGFGGKGPRSAEEYADALLELFERCRAVVRKQPK